MIVPVFVDDDVPPLVETGCTMPRVDDFLTVTAAAELLGVSPNTIRNWGRSGKIPERRHPLNHYRLYKREDLEAVLKQLDMVANRRAMRRKKG